MKDEFNLYNFISKISIVEQLNGKTNLNDSN